MRGLTTYLRSREPIDTILDSMIALILIFFVAMRVYQSPAEGAQPPRDSSIGSIQLSKISAPQHER